MVEEKITRPYLILKEYIRFLVNKIYYKKVYVADAGNVPPEGTPMLIVSDHQNSLMDALGILLSINDRKVHFIARADVFKIHPLATKFLYWIGLLPAFRLAFEGAEGLANNDETFRVSEQNLLDGRTVVIYPEAGHQDKHWLGKFSYGYTRMAFQAAELGNFETDIVILPACNHYSEYFALRSEGYTR
jgi:1-acyl-sn-glycerol-3-phosphate acyltransferase